MKRITVIWIMIVAASVVAQPFVLGFYSDDWVGCATATRVGGAFSRALLKFVFSFDPSRPGSAALGYLLGSIARDHVMLWHIGLVLANAVVALGLVFVIRLLSGADPRKNPMAIWVGLCWLVMPWNAAMQFWPSLLPYVVLLSGLWLLCVLLIRGWERNEHHALPAGAVYLCICMSYEAFYFQWMALLLLGVALWSAGRARLKDVALSTAGLLAAQVCAALWHLNAARLFGTGMIGVERPVLGDWPRILFGDLLTTIPSMYRSFGAARLPFAFLALALVIIFCTTWYRSVRSAQYRQSAWRCIRLAGCCLIGGVLSVFAFALGGRGIQAFGLATRTLVIFNFWLVVMAGICLIWLLENATRTMRTTALIAMGCLGLTLAAGHVMRLADWATAWELQKQLLAAAPVEELRKTPASATILLINRTAVNRVPIFSTSWDLNGAMPWKYPFLSGRFFRVYAPSQGDLEWDGQRLVYPRGGESETASDLYVWRAADGSVTRAVAPARVVSRGAGWDAAVVR